MMSAPDIGTSVLDRPKYCFGDVEVDTHARTVTRAGAIQEVEPKVYSVLLALLRRPGELVSRDELLDEVWGHRHVTPGVLTRAIAQLRHALDDDFHQPRYIRTRHSLGYCFIGELRSGPEECAPNEQPHPVDPARADGPAGCFGGDVEPALPMTDAGAAVGPIAATEPARIHPDPSVRAKQSGDAVAGFRRAWSARWISVAALGLVLVALVLAVFAWRRDAPVAIAGGKPSIAVLPFASVGSTRDDRYFAEGLAIEMHDALAQVPGLDVVAAAPSRSAAVEAPQVVGRRLQVENVLQAKVRRDGRRVRVSARLVDTSDGTTRWSRQFDGEGTDVFALQARIAGEVVQALVGALPDARVSRRLAPTRNAAAYDDYLKGLQLLQAGDGGAGLERAIAHFDAALRADPDFARAQAGICRARIQRFEDGLDADVFARAEAACAKAADMAPDLREVDLALGELYRARGDHDRAAAHFNRALDDVALRPEAHVGLARTHGALGRKAVAAGHFRRALQLSPNDASIHRELGYQAYLDGDLDAALRAYRRATQLAPGDERLWSSLGGLYLAAGQEKEAADAFVRSLSLRPNHAALSNYGSLRYDAGDYARAAELYQQAAAIDPSDFRTWGNLGDALAASAAPERAAEMSYRRAAELAERYLRIRSDDAQALALLSWYRANLGDRSGAIERLSQAEALGTEPAEVALLGAQTLALLGDRPSARTRLAHAVRLGVAERRLQASPQLQPLLAGEAAVAAQ